MTLQDFANDSHWRTAGYLNDFFEKYPKFKNAEIVIEDDIDYNFPVEYNYSFAWQVRLDTKHYNVIISEGGRFWSTTPIDKEGYDQELNETISGIFKSLQKVPKYIVMETETIYQDSLEGKEFTLRPSGKRLTTNIKEIIYE